MSKKKIYSNKSKGQKILKEWVKLSKNDPGQPMLSIHVQEIADEVTKAETRRKGAKTYKPIIGAVVGSVQSGKTATMIGLSAQLFAQGYQVITILTGLRNDLRYQSARRFYKDLFDSGEATYEFLPNKKIQQVSPQSFTHPKGDGNWGKLQIGTDFYIDLPLILDIDTDTLARLLPRVKSGLPAILFVKKIGRKGGGGTLGFLKNAISQLNDDLINLGRDPLRHAVIDDECDEASVGGSLKAAAPSEIEDIVKIGHGTYIGFTATAQANIFVTGPANPLRPKDFLQLLRYPANYNVGLPRKDVAWNPSVSKTVAYCGGFLYHEWNEARGEPEFFRQDLNYVEAVIAYIVSGAIRLVNKRSAKFPTKKDRTNGYLSKGFKLPDPHTMLVHTSHKIKEHYKAAEEMIQEIHNSLGSGKHISVSDDEDALNEWTEVCKILLQSVTAQPQIFKNWYDRFKISTTSVQKHSPGTKSLPAWKTVRSRLGEVINNIDLRIVNSRGNDENLLYDVSNIKIAGQSKQSIPQDIYPLVVSGNKMGRGITLEGLTITYFDRHPKLKVQDTIIQRQRWFGYHGERIGLVRIFCHQNEWAILRQINDDDEGLKQEIAKRKGVPPTDEKWATFFTGGAALTRKAKKGSLRHVAFDYSPRCHGYFRIVNNPASSAKVQKINMAAFDRWFKQLCSWGMKKPTSGSSYLRKHYFLGEQFNSGKATATKPIKHGKRLSATDIADIMESFYIYGHDPDPSSQQLGNPKALGVQSGYKMLARKGRRLEKFNGSLWKDDHLHVALYLRWWAKKIPATAPEFNVIIRNGASKAFRKVINRSGKSYRVTIGKGKLSTHVDPLNSKTPYIRPRTMGGRGKNQISDGRLDDMRSAWGPNPASQNGQEDPRKFGQPGLLILDLLNDGTGDIVRMGLILPEDGPSTKLAVQL